MAKGFEAALTTLHYPANVGLGHAARPAVFLSRLLEFEACGVDVFIDGHREADITISAYDPAVKFINPYSTMLWVRYRGKLAFWGVIPKPVFAEDDTVQLHAMDRSLSMQKHYLRIGDDVLIPVRPGSSTTYSNIDGVTETTYGIVPLTSQGLRRVMYAARLDPTAAPGVPDLGIQLGTTVGYPADTPWFSAVDPAGVGVTVKRGDEVWATMQNISTTSGTSGDPTQQAPEFELNPLDHVMRDPGSPPALTYAEINTFEQIGQEFDGVQMDDGWRRDNASIAYSPGGKLVNLDTALSSDGKHRVLGIHGTSMNQYGVYVQWDATSVDVKTDDLTALESVAAAVVGAYGLPPDFFTVNPKPDCTYHFAEDYKVGTTVQASKRRVLTDGTHWDRKMQGRITKVSLKQQSASSADVLEQLEVVPQIVGAGDITTVGEV